MAWPDCDVCGKPAKGVASSTLGGFGLAYCQECLVNHAEPKGLLVQTIEDCEGNVAEWVKAMTYYENGEYKSVRSLIDKGDTS